MCFAPQRRALFRHLNLGEWSEPLVFWTFWLRHVLRATTACTFSTSQPPKVVRTPSVLYILTWKCASRHNGVRFFDISTCKSGPTMVCFVHFDFEMCFAPQRRALFRHLNFQKWSDHGVFCAFWLRNMLRATTACAFSTSQLPKVVRTWCALCILTWKCASRHDGVQFFISHLASWLRTRRFSEPTFRPSGAPNHWKNTVFRDFPTFSRICIFFLLTLLSSYLSLLSASSLLCFSSVHIVGSLTSKLPSVTPPQMQLQLHYTNYTTPQLQLHYTTTTTTAALHHATSSSCGWGDRPGDHCNHCSHSEKHSSNHLSVHQWIRSAIRDSQQLISPIGSLFMKLAPPPCAVLYYWHIYVISKQTLQTFANYCLYLFTVFFQCFACMMQQKLRSTQ